ncbi:MAG: hypothetical protein O7H41_08135 [Planctomycetota bacterium]|nr:hypothetical protein [Planctomycetota bacterium]
MIELLRKAALVLGFLGILVSCGERDSRKDPRRDLTPVQAFVRLSQPGDLSEANFTRYDSFLSREYSAAVGLGAPAQDPIGQPLRRVPFGLALSSDDSKLYVTFAGNESEPLRSVGVIDTSPGGGLIREISVGLRPVAIQLSPDGGFLVVANEYSNYFSVIDASTDRVVRRPVSRFYNQKILFLGPTQVAVTNRAWDSLDLYDFDPSTGDLSFDREIPLHTRNRPFEIGLAPTDGPPMATPDGPEDLTVLGLPTGPGEPYDLATERVLTNINPRELCFLGGLVYVCAENGLGVSVVDPTLGDVVGTIDFNSPVRGCAASGDYLFFASGGRIAQAEADVSTPAQAVKRDPGRNEISVIDVRVDPMRIGARYTSLPNPSNGPAAGPPPDLATAIATLVPPTGVAPYLSAFGDATVPNTDANRDQLPPLVDGAVPTRMTVSGDKLYVTMQASDQVEVYSIDRLPMAPQDILTRLPASSAFTNSDQTAYPSAIDTTVRTDEGVYVTGSMNPGYFDGRMPEEVILSSAGDKVYVATRLGEAVSVLDATPNGMVFDRAIRLTISGYPPFPATLAEIGEDVFTSSRFTLDNNFSCLTCHPNSNTDSKLWQAGAAPGNVMRDPVAVRNQHDVFPYYNSGGRVHAETFRANTRDFSSDELFGGTRSPAPFDVNNDGLIDSLDEGYAVAYLYRNAMYVYERYGVGTEYISAALGAYLESEPRLPPNPFRGIGSVPVGLDLSGQRIYGEPGKGENYFYQAQCQTCHPPPVTTINLNMTLSFGMMDMDMDGIPDGVVPSLERDADFGPADLLSVPIERANTNAGDDDPDVWVTVLNMVNPRSPVSGRRYIINEADARNVRIKPHRGMWDTAPYLHHGRASTLLDVVDRRNLFNTFNRHGDIANLTFEQARDLAAYLQTIE